MDGPILPSEGARNFRTDFITDNITAVWRYPPLLDCGGLDRWPALPLVGLDDLCAAGGATRGIFRDVAASVDRSSWL